MSDTGKQSPLGVNSLSSVLVNKGLTINPQMKAWVGTSTSFPDYTFGKVCQDTVLRLITYAINQGYNGNPDGIPTSTVYNNLISIGGATKVIPILSITTAQVPDTDNYIITVTYDVNNGPTSPLTSGTFIRINGATPDGYNGNWAIDEVSTGSFTISSTAYYGAATTPGSFTVDTQVPALGNAKPMTYTWEQLIGPYGIGTWALGDTKGWGGSLYKNNLDAGSGANPATSWAYIRLLALQAWMEFNYNSTLVTGDTDNPKGYRDFLQSFMNAYSFIEYSNNAILAVDNSKTFLEGVYSNMNDLVTADITAVNLATKVFGQDLIALGKALDLSTISTFGLPSNLLKTLNEYNALTKNLSLAIIAAGIPTNTLSDILNGSTPPTADQERSLYAAFVITVGDALNEILIPLNCKTQGLTSVADLLNPQKLFPNSYASLTVPVYNTTQQPTNSRTAYPIYVDGGVNQNLSNPSIAEQLGSLVPAGTPPIIPNPDIGSATVTPVPVGFDSYLYGLVPSDLAIAAGAFSVAMQQIRNIKQVPIEKFAQVVSNLETMVGLNVASTNVPTNLTLRTESRPLIALGSGPQNSYTMSDFLGCMSGLPYNGGPANPSHFKPKPDGLYNIYNKLLELATTKLKNIYHELYLAVTWQRAKCSISQSTYNVLVQPYIPNPPNPNYQPDPGQPNYDPNPYVNYSTGTPTTDPNYQPRIDDWYYTIDIGLAVAGGGYSRGTAPAPLVTISPNNVVASMVVKATTDDTNIANFGRVSVVSKSNGDPYKYATTSVNQYTPPPAPTPPEEKIWIQAPPIADLPVETNGAISTAGVNVNGYGVGTAGYVDQGTWYWPTGGSTPGMNSPIQLYIDQANEEITSIYNTNTIKCRDLNDSWNASGNQLTIEQRARQTILKPPLEDTRNNYLSLFPTVDYAFIDSVPQYSQNTEPHMYAQTLEAITDLSTQGGLSMVAMMRQERNQARLTITGIPLDNNIPDTLPIDIQSQLISNGFVPGGVGTIPSLVQIDNGITVTPEPSGIYDPITNDYIVDNQPIDVGGSTEPGSFADSPYTEVIPPELDTWYTGNTLLPSTYTVAEAIDEVVRCNCDCWKLA